MKRIALLGSVLLLAGCGGSPVMSTPNTVDTKDIRLSDGREVACVVYVEHSITCDFDHPLSDISVPLEDEAK